MIDKIKEMIELERINRIGATRNYPVNMKAFNNHVNTANDLNAEIFKLTHGIVDNRLLYKTNLW